MDSFSLKLSRHDDHSIEIKTILELHASRFTGATDVYLFLPKSVQTLSWNRETLFSDFRSRARLSVPVRTDAGQTALQNTLSHVALIGESLRGGMDPVPSESVNEAAMRLASVVTETLKVYSRDHKKKLFLTHSLLGQNMNVTEAMREILNAVEGVGEWISQLRLLGKRGELFTFPTFRLLDEYLSYLFIQYLGDLRHEYDGARGRQAGLKGTGYGEAWLAFECVLGGLQTRELEHRRSEGYALLSADSDAGHEELLVRIGQLKKYFQSTMFLDISKQRTVQKISEPAAALAAGLAAAWAAVFQTFHHQELADIGLKGVFLMGSGIAAYILKDRLKDWSRRYLTEKAGKIFPDVESSLVLDEQQVGTTQEWFSLKTPRALPDAVREMRSRADLSEVEKALPEDVIHYRFDQTLKASERVSIGGAWAVQQTVRINLERYLKNMDDAYKEVTTLSPDGELRRTRCHRVYYFYMVISPRYYREDARTGRVPVKASDKLYRIVLDKNGVTRIESFT